MRWDSAATHFTVCVRALSVEADAAGVASCACEAELRVPLAQQETGRAVDAAWLRVSVSAGLLATIGRTATRARTSTAGARFLKACRTHRFTLGGPPFDKVSTLTRLPRR
jgi:hypothetical protein